MEDDRGSAEDEKKRAAVRRNCGFQGTPSKMKQEIRLTNGRLFNMLQDDNTRN
jgi:hypothetical protein